MGDEIFKNPELGFKEFKTSELVKKVFDELDLEYQDGLAITGVKAFSTGKNHDFRVAIMGELDAVVCPAHPYADPLTGASHSCGHNAQISSMLGAAIGLNLSGVLDELDGDVAFLAVPAEEFVELEYRERLRNEGKIKFFGGKQEFIRLGVFDDIDMAMLVHSEAGVEERKSFIGAGSNGFIGKAVKYIGKEAHAGGAPFEGVNALNAAMIGLMAIHAQRETFRDEDAIRVHPIITKGGDLVNIVPADVRVETYVRGRTMTAVIDANKKVNRALKAGAYAVGAEVEIDEIPGYLPLNQNEAMGELFKENMAVLIGQENVHQGQFMAGSTDMGDISSIMPAIHPTVGGFKGLAHSSNFEEVDKEMIYINPAKAMAMTAIDLLYDGAKLGKEIKSKYKPLYTKESYLKMWDELLNG
ncbi:MAG: amidohydrolase [Thermoanaerobacteraceae bacterium]|nr:amidohydrolase [Thermoanaerobacteraceae bacterium]